MSRVVPFLILTPLVMATTAPADETKKVEARRVVEKALRVMGGKEKLAAIKAATFKTKGKFYWLGAGTDFTGEMAVQGLAKARTVMTFDFGGKKQTIIAVVNGDKGWVKANDKVTEIDQKTLVVQMGDHGYITEMAMLLPLARGDRGIRLSPVGDGTVGDRPTIGVQISHKNYSTVRLFFDQETALPLKLEWKASVSGKEETHDILLGDYKEIGGLKVALKLTARRNGKVFYEYEVSDFKLADRLDDKLLEKPKWQSLPILWLGHSGRGSERYAEVDARVLRCLHLALNPPTRFGVIQRVNQRHGRPLATQGGYKILDHGAYEDRQVKDIGRWRIAYHRVRTDRLVSDLGKPINLADPDRAALVSHLVEAVPGESCEGGRRSRGGKPTEVSQA
jgi:hypothetical protein